MQLGVLAGPPRPTYFLMIVQPCDFRFAGAKAGRLGHRFGAHVVFNSQPNALKAAFLHLPGFLLDRQFQFLDLFLAGFLPGSHLPHPMLLAL